MPTYSVHSTAQRHPRRHSLRATGKHPKRILSMGHSPSLTCACLFNRRSSRRPLQLVHGKAGGTDVDHIFGLRPWTVEQSSLQTRCRPRHVSPCVPFFHALTFMSTFQGTIGPRCLTEGDERGSEHAPPVRRASPRRIQRGQAHPWAVRSHRRHRRRNAQLLPCLVRRMRTRALGSWYSGHGGATTNVLKRNHG